MGRGRRQTTGPESSSSPLRGDTSGPGTEINPDQLQFDFDETSNNTSEGVSFDSFQSFNEIRANIKPEEKIQLDKEIYNYAYDPTSNAGVEGVARIVSARSEKFNKETFIAELSSDGGKTIKPELDAGEEEYLNMLAKEVVGYDRLNDLAMNDIRNDGDALDRASAYEDGPHPALLNHILRTIWLNPTENEYLHVEDCPSFETWVFQQNIETMAKAVDNANGPGDFLRSFL